MKIKNIGFIAFFILMINGVFAVGVQPPTPNATIPSPGGLGELAFSLVLENETVNLSLQNPSDSSWFPYTTFPLTFSQDGMNNLSLPVKAPPVYTESTKNIVFVANSTATSMSFNTIIYIQQPTEWEERWNDWLSAGEGLSLNGLLTIRVPSAGILGSQILLTFSGCPFTNQILNKNESKTINCYNLIFNLTYLDNFGTSKVKLQITGPSTLIISRLPEETSTVRIMKLSRICPSKAAIIKITDEFGSAINGIVTISNSKDDAVDTITLSNGYGKFIVPSNEHEYLSLQIDTEGKIIMEILPISSGCDGGSYENESIQGNNSLKIVALETEKTIHLNEDSVTITVVVRNSITNSGVENCNIIVYKDGSVDVQKSGIAGYKNIVFSSPGTYTLHAECNGYIASNEVNIKIDKEQLPKVSLRAKEENGNLTTEIQKGELIRFELFKEDGEIYNFNGAIRMSYDNYNKETTVQFHNGIAEFRATEKGDYHFYLSEIKTIDAEDQIFIVKEPLFDIGGIIGNIYFWVIIFIIVIIIFVSKRKSKVRAGYESTPGMEFLGKAG